MVGMRFLQSNDHHTFCDKDILANTFLPVFKIFSYKFSETTGNIPPLHHLLGRPAQPLPQPHPLHEGRGQVNLSSKRLCQGNVKNCNANC